MIGEVRRAADRLGVFTADDLRAETGLRREQVEAALAVLRDSGRILPATSAGSAPDPDPAAGQAVGAHCSGCPIATVCHTGTCSGFAEEWQSSPRYRCASAGSMIRTEVM